MEEEEFTPTHTTFCRGTMLNVATNDGIVYNVDGRVITYPAKRQSKALRRLEAKRARQQREFDSLSGIVPGSGYMHTKRLARIKGEGFHLAGAQ